MGRFDTIKEWLKFGSGREKNGYAGETSDIQVQSKQSMIKRFSFNRKKEERLAALQAGYSDVMGMVSSINEHLQAQTASQEKMLSFMDRLTGAADGLQGINKAAEQQAETLQVIREQMEHSVGHGKQMVDSLNRFNDTLTVMDKSSKNTADTLVTLVERMRSSEDLLRNNLERAEKRLVILVSSLIILIAVAVGVAFFMSPYADSLWKRSTAPEAVVQDASPESPTQEHKSIVGSGDGTETRQNELDEVVSP